MSIRVKFRLTERADLYYSDTAKRLTFTAENDVSVPADDRLCQGAPTCSFTAIADNPLALAALEIGGLYWFDITPVEDR